jgi:hypothetical protein
MDVRNLKIIPLLFLYVVLMLCLYSLINRVLIYLIFSYKLGNGIGPKSIFGLVCNRHKLGIEIGINLVLG